MVTATTVSAGQVGTAPGRRANARDPPT